MHQQTAIPPWTLQSVTSHNADEVLIFVNNARRELFPDLPLSPDDESMLRYGSRFLAAHDGKRVIAVIGYVPYDHRFAHLDYRKVQTAEVVRLFVLPEYRRCGLAAALFAALRERAGEEGLECFYLHTHPFLPGAIRFWEKQGFHVVDVEENPIWRTTHMQLMLEAKEDTVQYLEHHIQPILASVQGQKSHV
ncbi:acyl-CoA N-acyltransferase [Pyrenochaeta sp. MPI-SDFR-AT-0127]|nr:acyl-CoA N-acyltransferase [Pyrenochaeta sp. MPI-SDFR-AT-0127]